MKKIYLFTIITALSVIGLNLKSHAQTKTVKHIKHAPVKTASTVNSASKTEYVDFNMMAGDTVVAFCKRLLLADLINEVGHKRLVAYDVTANPSAQNIYLKPITYKTLMKRLADTAVIDVIDMDGNKIGKKVLRNDFTPDKLTGYRIQRQLITNKQTGLTSTIITGIAPSLPLVLSNGDTITANQPVCWFKYDQCKKIVSSKSTSANSKQWDSNAWESLFVGGKVRE